MNVHKNARLTPAGRVLLVERIERGWPVGEAASASGVSVRTAHEWYDGIGREIGNCTIAARPRTLARIIRERAK